MGWLLATLKKATLYIGEWRSVNRTTLDTYYNNETAQPSTICLLILTDKLMEKLFLFWGIKRFY